jgi:long-chain fatty acid transport protein
MKKILSLILGICLFAQIGFAGGIVTNTNQSAAWVRSLVRDASLNPDAVYFNPAGVARMADGFYLEVSNQFITQTKTITNGYPLLNGNSFVGDVSAPIFPTAYAIFKKGKFAVHAGFGVVGGGGSAEYKTGLPSFEIPISGIPASLTANNILTNHYSANIYFSGTSSYMGIQLGASYKINEFIAIGIGARYITAKNTYSGYVKSIMIDPLYPAFGAQYNGSMVSAPDFFTDGGNFLTGLANGSTQMAAGLGQIVTGGGGSVLLANGTVVGLTATQVAQAQQLIGAAGQNPANMTIQQAQEVLTAAAPAFQDKANTMIANAAATRDLEVEAEQKGTSITPIVSVDLSMLDGKLGIALKYENKTPLELKNVTTIDGSGMFPDGKLVPAEMPSLFSLGVRYQISDKFRTQIGAHYYLDRNAKYGKIDAITKDYVTNGAVVNKTDGTNGAYLDGNSYELGIALEYDVAKFLSLSCGYLNTASAPTTAYQSDLSYSLKTNSVGAGAIIHIVNKLDLNLGVSHTFYTDGSKAINYPGVGPTTESYKNNTTVLALGLGYRF